jgi:branched-chain amino acid transport system substrate-binding protein
MRRNVSRRSGYALITVVAATAMAVAGCGGSSSSAGSSTGDSSSSPAAAALGTLKAATGTPIKVGGFTDSSLGPQSVQSQAGYTAAVSYVNAYLAGINGHPVRVDFCDVKGTPAGGTNCAVQFRKDGVAAVITPTLSVDAAVFTALSGSGIPYFTFTTASPTLLAQPNAFVVGSPLATTAEPAVLDKNKGIKKAAIIIIDVPSATGPVKALATPLYAGLGIGLDVVPIALGTPDMTPQIQQAISAGAKSFSVIGTASFVGSAMKGLKQLGFSGPIMIDPGEFDQAAVDSVPGGLAGATATTQLTTSPSDKDVQTYRAAMAKYAPSVDPNSYASSNFEIVLAFQRALNGVSGASDAKSISAALAAMPKPVALPMGAGITFQCGAKVVALTPNVCSSAVLQADVGADGSETNVRTLDLSAYLKVG